MVVRWLLLSLRFLDILWQLLVQCTYYTGRLNGRGQIFCMGYGGVDAVESARKRINLFELSVRSDKSP